MDVRTTLNIKDNTFRFQFYKTTNSWTKMTTKPIVLCVPSNVSKAFAMQTMVLFRTQTHCLPHPQVSPSKSMLDVTPKPKYTKCAVKIKHIVVIFRQTSVRHSYKHAVLDGLCVHCLKSSGQASTKSLWREAKRGGNGFNTKTYWNKERKCYTAVVNPDGLLQVIPEFTYAISSSTSDMSAIMTNKTKAVPIPNINILSSIDMTWTMKPSSG